jgi:hypothetical protein
MSRQKVAPARRATEDGDVIRLACPTGCAGTIGRPYTLRATPFRCPNCRAWLAAAPELEDGALAEGVLVARPGEVWPPPRLPWWRRLFGYQTTRSAPTKAR